MFLTQFYKLLHIIGSFSSRESLFWSFYFCKYRFNLLQYCVHVMQIIIMLVHILFKAYEEMTCGLLLACYYLLLDKVFFWMYPRGRNGSYIKILSSLYDGLGL